MTNFLQDSCRICGWSSHGAAGSEEEAGFPGGRGGGGSEASVANGKVGTQVALHV